MRIYSNNDIHRIVLEDKEDLIHCRPILNHADLKIRRKVYKKEEYKVKRKQEIIWEQLILKDVSSRIKENLLIEGISSKGKRVIYLSPGDQFVLYKNLTNMDLNIINFLKKKRILQVSVDCNSIIVGQILHNRFKTLIRKYYTLKDDFDLNQITKDIIKKFNSEDYHKIIYKTSSALINLLDGQWTSCTDPTEWRSQSMYAEKYKNLIRKALYKKYTMVNKLDQIIESIESGNVQCIYITEHTSDELLELIYVQKLEPKTIYVPMDSSIKWILEDIVLFTYF